MSQADWNELVKATEKLDNILGEDPDKNKVEPATTQEFITNVAKALMDKVFEQEKERFQKEVLARDFLSTSSATSRTIAWSGGKSVFNYEEEQKKTKEAMKPKVVDDSGERQIKF